MAKTFFEVLEEQIRSELRSEIEAEIHSQLRAKLGQVGQDAGTVKAATGDLTGRLESWLATRLETTVFASRAAGAKAYGASPAKAGKTSAQPVQALTGQTPSKAQDQYKPESIADLCAAELLRRYGGKLGEEFTEGQLKTAWRKAALQTHPDRFAQSDAITQARMAIAFRELCNAYEQLLLAFEQKRGQEAAA